MIYIHSTLKVVSCKGIAAKLLSHHSKGFLGESTSNTNFVVDGIDISFLNEDSISHDDKMVLMKEKETDFVDRISLTISEVIN